jgi:hypothetical protein
LPENDATKQQQFLLKATATVQPVLPPAAFSCPRIFRAKQKEAKGVSISMLNFQADG